MLIEFLAPSVNVTPGDERVRHEQQVLETEARQR